MSNKMYLCLAAILAVSSAQAQQNADSKFFGNKDSERTERKHVEKKTQQYAQSESVDRDEIQNTKRNESLEIKSSETGTGNTRAESQSRDPNAAPSPKMKRAKGYDEMSADERKVLIEKLERIIVKNENNRDFNRESYQKRIDLLRSLNE